MDGPRGHGGIVGVWGRQRGRVGHGEKGGVADGGEEGGSGSEIVGSLGGVGVGLGVRAREGDREGVVVHGVEGEEGHLLLPIGS